MKTASAIRKRGYKTTPEFLEKRLRAARNNITGVHFGPSLAPAFHHMKDERRDQCIRHISEIMAKLSEALNALEHTKPAS